MRIYDNGELTELGIRHRMDLCKNRINKIPGYEIKPEYKKDLIEIYEGHIATYNDILTAMKADNA